MKVYSCYNNKQFSCKFLTFSSNVRFIPREISFLFRGVEKGVYTSRRTLVHAWNFY